MDAYYDSFQYMYGETLGMVEIDPFHKQKDSGVFNPMYLCLSKEVTLPQDKTIIPFSQYETGILKYGNADPAAKDFNSLADFNESAGNIEIRIPWQLLNMMDPSTKAVMSDLHQAKGISPQVVDGFALGAGILKKDQQNEVNKTIGMNGYSWAAWEEPTFHERLKPSYYILQNAFKAMD